MSEEGEGRQKKGARREGEARGARPRSVPTKRELEQLVGELKDRVAALEREVGEREGALEQGRDRMLRALAEAQNTRRRAAEERRRALALQKDEVVGTFLPVLDNLRLALDSGAGHKEVLEDGLRLILRQLEDVLRSHGVSVVGAVGERFDPNRHQAVERVTSAEVRPGHIVEVLGPGFAREGRVIREARVKVAVEPPAGEEQETAEGEEAEA